MRKNIWTQWLAVTALVGVNASWICAFDDPQTTNKIQVTVDHDHEGSETGDVLAKVEAELNKAKLSNEIKSKILEQVKGAVLKGMAKKFAAKASTDDGKKTEEVVVTVIDGTSKNKSPAVGEVFRTRLVRPMLGENYRIGVACQVAYKQTEDGDTTDAERKPGLRIETVIDHTPAAKAGIKAGDILVTANAKPIREVAELTEVIQKSGKDDKVVTLELLRDEKTINVEVKPIKMKAADVEMDDLEKWLPQSGFLTDGDALKKWQEQAKQWKPENFANGFAIKVDGAHVDLKKEIDELKSEIKDLKKLIKELIDKK